MSISLAQVGLFLGFCYSAFALAATPAPVAGPELTLAEAQKMYRGVSLTDLADPVTGYQPLAGLAAKAREYVAAQAELQFKKNVSVSMHALGARTLTVDVFGRDPRFPIMHKREKGQGGVGFMRVELELALHDADVEVLGHKIVLQRDFGEMSPVGTVSLYDRLVKIEDKETRFRRIFILDVGSMDSVRYRNVNTIMTPTSELAILDKNRIIRERGSKDKNDPDYPYKSKPFLKILVPNADPATAKRVYYDYRSIAFHTYMNPPGFKRGFLSHGCMRMRDSDLLEFRDFVEGVKTVLPVRLRIEYVADARHPFPTYNEKYSRVKNFGTKKNPRAKRELEHGTMLTVTETLSKYLKVKGKFVENPAYEFPTVDSFVGMSQDPDGYGPLPIDAEVE